MKNNGDLLFTTLSEECSEIIQACSKIQRKKYFHQFLDDEIDNLLEEIQDVQNNIELIKEQIIKEENCTYNIKKLNERITYWKIRKERKLEEVFPNEDENGN